MDLDELKKKMGREPNPSPRQQKFGNEVFQTSKLMVQKLGWEEAVYRVNDQVMTAGVVLTRHFQNPMEVGQTVTVTQDLIDDYQQLMMAFAVMGALGAIKSGLDLTEQDLPAEH